MRGDRHACRQQLWPRGGDDELTAAFDLESEVVERTPDGAVFDLCLGDRRGRETLEPQVFLDVLEDRLETTALGISVISPASAL